MSRRPADRRSSALFGRIARSAAQRLAASRRRRPWRDTRRRSAGDASEPIQQLARAHRVAANAAAVTEVALPRGLEDDVARRRIADAGLEAPHRRFPSLWTRARRALCRSRADRRAPRDERRAGSGSGLRGAPRSRRASRPHCSARSKRHGPRRPDRLASSEETAVRKFRVAPNGLLHAVGDRPRPRASASSRLLDRYAPRAERAAKRQLRPGRTTTRPATCLPSLSSPTRGSESEPAVTEPVHSIMPFTPCA